MSRYGPQGPAMVIGPGPMTPAVRALVYANVGVFVLTWFAPAAVVGAFGLAPVVVFEQFQVWRLATYLFVHDPNGFTHILFNMLALWMFGVDLERRWGTVGFVKYYAVTGVGAGIATALLSLLPFDAMRAMYDVTTVGASGAIYGLLLAWALLFPHRNILFMFIFPLPARVAAILMGAMAFLAATSGRSSGVAEATHLSGLVIGWFYLKGPRNTRLDLQYRLTKWRMSRMRKRFDVHQGGRGPGDWGGRVH
jgi:membrane associated rhomboid family serine protease